LSGGKFLFDFCHCRALIALMLASAAAKSGASVASGTFGGRLQDFVSCFDGMAHSSERFIALLHFVFFPKIYDLFQHWN
jgi:hypothetical protein